VLVTACLFCQIFAGKAKPNPGMGSHEGFPTRVGSSLAWKY